MHTHTVEAPHPVTVSHEHGAVYRHFPTTENAMPSLAVGQLDLGVTGGSTPANSDFGVAGFVYFCDQPRFWLANKGGVRHKTRN